MPYQRREFWGSLAGDYPFVPLEVRWEAGRDCPHEPPACQCVNVHTTSAIARHLMTDDAGNDVYRARTASGFEAPQTGVHGDLEYSGFGGGTFLQAAELDKLIATLQRARREVYGDPPPTAAVIEIIDPGHTTDDTPGGSLIIPSELRINGHRVLTCRGGVKIHEISVPGHDMATITVTLPARRITIAAEGDVRGETRMGGESGDAPHG